MPPAITARAAAALLLLLLAACDREAGTSGGAVPPARPAQAGEVRDADPKTLTPGPVRRESLTDEQMARVRKLTEALKEVEHNPIEVWVDNFKRDADPDAEIRIWENIAAAYTNYTARRGLTQEAKDDVFRLLLSRSMMPAEDVLRRVKLRALSEQQARDALALYSAPAQPVTVIRQ